MDAAQTDPDAQETPAVAPAPAPGSAPAPAPASARAAWAALVVGLVATAGYFVVPAGYQETVYVGVGVASVVAVLVGVRRYRPAGWRGWLLLGAANACFVAGDEAAQLYASVTGRDLPSPSFVDALYLAGYPLLIAAVLLLARAAGLAATREHRIDAAVITVGALAAGWQPLVEPVAGGPAESLLARIVTAGYPAMDVGVLFIVLSAVIAARASTVAHRLVALSIGFMLAADVVYALGRLDGTYTDGDPVDAGWLLSYVVLAAAALHPSMATRAPDRDDHRHPRRWIVAVSIAAFLPLAVLMARAIDDRDLVLAAAVGFSIATFAFIGVRTVLLFGRVGAQSRELAEQARSLRVALAAGQALEADLRHRAYHDDLTGLPNRAGIRHHLDAALAEAARGRPDRDGVAFCLIDLDRFKSVNDSLGHLTGDAVLIAVGRRLREHAGVGAEVGRLGGDEFACVLRGADAAAAGRIAGRIVDAMREPIEVAGRRIQLSSSVGLALADRSSDGTALLTRADTAMYGAKTAGRDRWQLWEPAMGAHLAEQLAITNAFPDALRREEFSVVHQPVFTLPDGRLKGFESLVRWEHPTLGPVGPDRFVPLAEETGFVVPLGRWVLGTACRAAADWPVETTVAVNISARQLADPAIVDDVRAALAASGLPAARLVVEVTESAIMDNVEQAARVVDALKELGVVIAMDDFGTGHSSLAHLRDLPIDIVKIDRSFVAPLGGPAGSAMAYVEAIVGLARALGMSTVAEGVESLAQYEALRAVGCDTVQGYFTGRPLPAELAADMARAAVGGRPQWLLQDATV